MELDLLEENKVFGKNRLSIFAKHVAKASNTDFSILLGGDSSSNYHTREGNTLKNRAGCWWTKTPYTETTNVIYNYICHGCRFNNRRDAGIRPILPCSLIQSVSLNKIREVNEIKEIEYGEYPQYVVDENYSRKLEEAYNNGGLRTTGKKYTTDSVKYDDYSKKIIPRTFIEYEYNSIKYIRFVGDSNSNRKLLSDGRKIKIGEIYWVKVEPITWLLDENKNIAITKNIIVSGIQFDNKDRYNGDFKETDIYKYMNTYLVKDMFNSVSINKKNDNNKEFESINNKIKTLRKRIDDIRK